jgi:ribosomal protein S12 methylthiotransferase accessory factor
MDIIVSLPGGKRVDAQIGRFTIHTDQPPEEGGEGSAPEPFALFLASLATCAGAYVVGFCQARKIPTEGIRLIQRTENDATSGRLMRVTLEVQVPSDFPPRYRDAVARAAAACKVKKTLSDAPEILATTSVWQQVHAAPAA